MMLQNRPNLAAPCGKSRTQAVPRQLRRRADAGSERAQKTALRQLAEGEPYDTAKVVRSNQNSGSTYQGVAPSTGNLRACRDQIAPIVTPELNYCLRDYREGTGGKQEGPVPHPPSLVSDMVER
jgi:hypothetical protein